MENASVVAQWEDSDSLLRLVRISYRGRIALLLTAKRADAVAEQAMVAYHQQLASGRTASEALAATLAEHPAAGAFCLFGTDWRPDPSQIQRAGSLNIAS